MKNEFVKYEQALALKELGFDEECFGWYDDISKEFYPIRTIGWTDKVGKNASQAPLYQQAFRWFRKEYNLWIEISKPMGWLLTIIDKERNIRTCLEDYDDYVEPTSYEEAELACLRKLIEIVNQNKDE